jgi:pimeloyl-ACP methyl ester carboxylesterase
VSDVRPASELIYERFDLRVQGVGLSVAAARRDGDLAPIIFLHGFGSTKEDYVDLALQHAFAGRALVAYDAPGCGETSCEDLSGISIPFLIDTAEAVLRHLDIGRFHLVGHSMGGLTALLLAHQHADRVLSFVDIEGNVAPEDCFLSRQVLTHPGDDPESFFEDFISRTRRAPTYSSALYAAGLRHKVRAAAVKGIFESLVELSDHGDLMSKFISLPCPRMFMYGEQNTALSYLPTLAANGVELVEIPHCGHFPMYSNPVAMWERIAKFYARNAPVRIVGERETRSRTSSGAATKSATTATDREIRAGADSVRS